MKEKKISKEVIITVLVCITVLEAIALLTGHNGGILRIVLVIFALIAGITIPSPIKIK